MDSAWTSFLRSAAFAGIFAATCTAADKPTEMVPLQPVFPKPMYSGTPWPLPRVRNLEEPVIGNPKPLMLPVNAFNVAAKRIVTSSERLFVIGSPEMVTDGIKDSYDGCYVELGRGLQWIQIDLSWRARLYAIVIWHRHVGLSVYHDVIVEVSDDPEFKKDVKVVFNNDDDNTAGRGLGKDKAYIATHKGKQIAVNGVPARYVRIYSNGNTRDELSHYAEVEVYGTLDNPAASVVSPLHTASGKFVPD